MPVDSISKQINQTDRTSNDVTFLIKDILRLVYLNWQVSEAKAICI